MVKRGIFRAGTSGLVLVEPNKQAFPAEFRSKSRLEYYSSLWNSIEINSSFYKIHRADTFRKWTLQVPEQFRFTVKLWKGITHEKFFRSEVQEIKPFFDAVNGLGNKKGCLLVQFPATANRNLAGLTQLLQSIRDLDPDQTWRIAVEFRHHQWYQEDVYELLDEFQATLVLHDMPKSVPPKVNGGATFIYYRFHGVNGDYRGSYVDAFLKNIASEIRGWLNRGTDVYAYFNNTIGDAVGNLQTLKKQLDDIR